jgi:hypothetical protein
MALSHWIVCFSIPLVATCAATPPVASQIDRLPQGAAGTIAPPRSTPISLEELVQMAREGTPSNVIIQTLRDTRATYALTAQEAQALAGRGVPPDVIAHLRGEDPERWAGSHAHDPYDVPYYPAYGWGYPYGWSHPYSWSHPYGPWYPGTGLYFGFGRRW